MSETYKTRRSQRTKGQLVDLLPKDGSVPTGSDDSKTDEELLQLAFRRMTVATTLEYALLTVARHKLSDLVDTACVTLLPGNDVELHVNPKHLREMGSAGYVFILCHEAYHLLDDDLGNDVLSQIATEAVTNHRVKLHTGLDLPVGPDGKKQGVDPDAVYRSYARAVEDPVSKDKFLESKTACTAYLRQMPKPPKIKAHFCHHVDPEAGGIPHRLPTTGDGSGEGTGDGDQSQTGGTIDPKEAEGVVADVLGALVQDALNGDEETRKVLLELEQTFPDSKTWGNLPLGALRGEKVTTRRTPFWEHALRRVMGTQLMPGARLAYNKKLWWSKTLLPCGKEPEKHVAVYSDSSGSMGQQVLQVVQRIVAPIPGVTMDVHWFDTEVYEAEPGGDILGGGGTSFTPIIEHVASLETEPDAVVVITDGHAPRIDPPRKGDWIWIITPNGNPWPADEGMEMIVVDDVSLFDGG